MPNEPKIISMQKASFFSGKRRIGLDTNVLIKLYNNPGLFGYEEARIFNKKDVIFIHPISEYELSKYIKEKGFDKESAKSEAKKFLGEHNIKKVYCFIPNEHINNFESECNVKFKQAGKEHLKCHTPDSIILLAFKRKGINKVISTDEAFREGASLLGMDSSKLPSLDYAISRELKKIFDYRKKYYRKKRH